MFRRFAAAVCSIFFCFTPVTVATVVSSLLWTNRTNRLTLLTLLTTSYNRACNSWGEPPSKKETSLFWVVLGVLDPPFQKHQNRAEPLKIGRNHPSSFKFFDEQPTHLPRLSPQLSFFSPGDASSRYTASLRQGWRSNWPGGWIWPWGFLTMISYCRLNTLIPLMWVGST